MVLNNVFLLILLLLVHVLSLSCFCVFSPFLCIITSPCSLLSWNYLDAYKIRTHKSFSRKQQLYKHRHIHSHCIRLSSNDEPNRCYCENQMVFKLRKAHNTQFSILSQHNNRHDEWLRCAVIFDGIKIIAR